MFTRGNLIAGLGLVAAQSLGLVSAAAASEAPSSSKATTGETRTLPGGAVLTFSKDAKYSLGRPIKLELSTTGNEKTPVQLIRFGGGPVSVSFRNTKRPKGPVLTQAPRKVRAVARGGQS